MIQIKQIKEFNENNTLVIRDYNDDNQVLRTYYFDGENTLVEDFNSKERMIFDDKKIISFKLRNKNIPTGEYNVFDGDKIIYHTIYDDEDIYFYVYNPNEEKIIELIDYNFNRFKQRKIEVDYNDSEIHSIHIFNEKNIYTKSFLKEEEYNPNNGKQVYIFKNSYRDETKKVKFTNKKHELENNPEKLQLTTYIPKVFIDESEKEYLGDISLPSGNISIFEPYFFNGVNTSYSFNLKKSVLPGKYKLFLHKINSKDNNGIIGVSIKSMKK